MWDYSEKVKEHFFNPRNAGRIEDANATGEVGSMACGDALRLTLRVDPENERILEAGFETFGCGSAIASSSALTEIVKGMTLDEALEVTNQDIADYLEGLPPEKMHCSVMGREALQAAISDYRGEVWSDDHEEGALVCRCFAIDEPLIRKTVFENGLTTVEDVTNYTKAGGSCACCHEAIENILAECLAEKGDTNTVVVEEVEEPQPQVAAKSEGMTIYERIRRIETVIESVRPTLQADKGDVELVDFDGEMVYVRMVGACAGCSASSVTLGYIQQRLMEAMGELIPVVPVQESRRWVVGR